MKAFKFLALAAVFAFAFTSCTKVEKILPKKDGRWDVTSVDSKVYWDGVQVIDTVTTEGNGFIVFNEDGTGYTEDDNGTKDSGSDFTWTADNDQITVTDSSDTYTSDVLEASKKELTLSLTIEETDSFFGTIRSETISVLERAE